jgi:phosphate starvation-inducible protein PhoH
MNTQSSKFSHSIISLSDASREVDKFYNRMDDYQRNMYSSIFDKSVVCCNCKAGTGKTTIAVAAGVTMLNRGIVNKIVYLRFPDDRSLRLGFFPGNMDEKSQYYFYPLFEALYNFGFRDEDIENYIYNEQIEICTDVALRGRNIEKSLVICDESQNARFSDLKLALTRLHDSSKCFLLGMSAQRDNFKGTEEYAFEKYIDHLTQKSWAVNIDLVKNYRGKISTWCDELELIK